MAHFGDPQVLQKEGGADVSVGPQPSALPGEEAVGRRKRLPSPAPHALAARARSLLGALGQAQERARCR